MNSDASAETGEFAPLPRKRPDVNVEVRVGGYSHQGNVRPSNEDCYLVSQFGRALRTLLTNIPAEHAPPPHEETGYAMLVADGLGGAAAGEVASRTAIQLLAELAVETRDWIFLRDEAQAEKVMERMVERFRTIDRVLNQQAQADPAYAGMGTTLTLAASLGIDLIICNIGDSRAYLFRDGHLQQLTRDMTVAQDLVDMGVLDAESARRLRHILTQCLGTGKAQADVHYRALRDKDRLMVCSDGLTEMLTEAQIAEPLGLIADPGDACRELVEFAMEAGGRDNVTVVMADYEVR